MAHSDATAAFGHKETSLEAQQRRDKARRQFDERIEHENEYAIEHGETLIAGALAGLVSETLMHPFDTISLRAKVSNGSYGSVAGAFKLIFKQEGLRGYFAGVSATACSSIPSSAVYFTVYETIKNTLNHASDHKYESVVYFTSGALSEVAASLLVAPIEVVKARLQLGANPHRATGGLVGATTNFPSVPAALLGVYRERGFRGLVAGWNAGLLMDMSYSATQFLLYESIKNAQIRAKLQQAEQEEGQPQRQSPFSSLLGGGSASVSSSNVVSSGSAAASSHLSTRETLLAGSIAGCIAAVVTNPLDVVTSRLMVQDAGHRYGGGMWAVVRQTVNEGAVAMWRGTLPRAAQLAPMSALSFSVYEAMRLYLLGGHPPTSSPSSGPSAHAGSSGSTNSSSGSGSSSSSSTSVVGNRASMIALGEAWNQGSISSSNAAAASSAAASCSSNSSSDRLPMRQGLGQTASAVNSDITRRAAARTDHDRGAMLMMIARAVDRSSGSELSLDDDSIDRRGTFSTNDADSDTTNDNDGKDMNNGKCDNMGSERSGARAAAERLKSAAVEAFWRLHSLWRAPQPADRLAAVSLSPHGLLALASEARGGENYLR